MDETNTSRFSFHFFKAVFRKDSEGGELKEDNVEIFSKPIDEYV
jgi:hypothetical protein